MNINKKNCLTIEQQKKNNHRNLHFNRIYVEKRKKNSFLVKSLLGKAGVNRPPADSLANWYIFPMYIFRDAGRKMWKNKYYIQLG